jgi:hypothetical protein
VNYQVLNLRRMLTALERTIERLEAQDSPSREKTIRRLRLVQADLLSALHLAERDKHDERDAA